MLITKYEVMNFTEETGAAIETIDINTLVVPKKRVRKSKKTTVEPTDPTDPLQKLTSEKDKLKAELLRLSDYHPEIVTKPVNDKIAKLVEEMSIEELRERVRFGKRNQSSKMDDSVANQTILMANQVAGRMLGCLEELNESSMKDKLLNECLKDYLCLNILDYIPTELKITGLYGSHVSSAYYKASLKKTPRIVEEVPEVIPEEIPEEIKRKISENPEMKEKLELLKSRLVGLGM
tara:strand:+ start:240 stop:944 length:705 start_codon:yes stop_codon:yes gene_type:complete